MIANTDRKGWFGASDTKYVIGSFDTKIFKDWWKTKTGETVCNYENIAMKTGTLYEHPIMKTFAELNEIEHLELDKQVINEELLLRVNLDANTEDTILECKTTQLHISKLNIPRQYIDQVNVQMYATGLRKAYLVFYRVTKEDYEAVENDTILDIDATRFYTYKVDYNESWIKDVYLPRLKYLAECLRNNTEPCESKIATANNNLPSVIPNEQAFNEVNIALENLNAKKKEIEEQKALLEIAVIEYMEKNGIKSYKNDKLSITYVVPTTRTTIDSKALKEKYPEIVEECSKETTTKASLRIKLND